MSDLEEEINGKKGEVMKEAERMMKTEIKQIKVNSNTAQEACKEGRALIKGEMEGIKNELQILRDRDSSKREKYSDKLKEESEIGLEIRKEIVEKALPMFKQEVDRFRSIVITGVKESQRETWQDRERDDDRSVYEILRVMQLEYAYHEITSRYRLGRYDRQKPGSRPIKVTFTGELTQREVLKHTWTLKQNKRFASVYVRRDLTKDERMKINKIGEETRKRNNERTEHQKTEFFWKRNGLMEPQKVFIRVDGEGQENGGGIR